MGPRDARIGSTHTSNTKAPTPYPDPQAPGPVTPSTRVTRSLTLPGTPSYDSTANFMRCSMKTLRLTSSVGMTWPAWTSVELCVTLGFNFQMRKRASDLCWSAMM